ncbi:MAG: ankyrin repeat domain-containing protein [Acidimicrobiia bacterium]|nr:ankyrin repeat domain-containing protein [Acidimicrobiia bacterium]
MPTVPLPQDPDLGQLRTRARELQRAVRAGQADACALAAEHHPSPPDLATFPLSAAQLVLARRHGFASWARLRRHVEVVHARSWTPGAPAPDDEPLADRFLRLACLTYEDDSPSQRDAAAQLLREHPELPGSNIAVAAACADVDSVRRQLADDPSLATSILAPHGWSPLLYQAYARHDLDIGWEATRDTARLLLDAGADPNDGRFWHGLPTPFTVLTGVFGSGEQDQPTHPHALGFARLLLDAGADPNDEQALYNRMFGPNDDHLVLLFEFGLGRDTKGPWHRLLGDALESPAVMLRNLLWWAVTHDQRERVELLAANGVDVVSPFTELRVDAANGATPLEIALTSGHRALADQLLALGARQVDLEPVDAFIAAVMAGDEDAVRATDRATVTEARRLRFGLPVWAAEQGAPSSVGLLVEAGFDVNAYGRSDVPSNQPWETGLHVAAGNGDTELVRTLLELGADPQLLDARYDATPLGWARFFDQQEVVELLAPLTSEPDPSP